MLAPFLVIACGLTVPRTVALSQGATISPPNAPSFQYWNEEDATIDSSDPDFNFGGQSTIDGGPGKVILIQFGDLARALGPNAKVLSAKLMLTPTSKQSPHLKAARQVLATWHEGPVLTVAAMLEEHRKAPKVGSAKAVHKTPNLSATWRHRLGGEESIAWQTPGADGPNDSQPIAGVTMVQTLDGGIEIDGLESTIQSDADRWYDNHGIALEFDTPVEFESGKSASGRPTLSLQMENGPSPSGPDLSVAWIERAAPVGGSDPIFIAHVKNVGDAPAPAFKASWVCSGRTGPQFEIAAALAPGQETTIQAVLPVKAGSHDHRLGAVGLRLYPSAGDANAQNDYLEICPDAIPIDVFVDRGWFDGSVGMTGSKSFEDWIQAQFRVWNDTFLARSRFSFAPDGSTQRVRIGKITTVDVGSPDPADGLNIRFRSGDNPYREPLGCSRILLHALSAKLGLTDLGKLQLSAERVVLQGAAKRAALDPFPGIMGGGDTRFEGAVPPEFALPLDPSVGPELVKGSFEPTDLYAATDIGALNDQVVGGSIEGSLGKLPRLTLVQVTNRAGIALPRLSISVFQSANGTITDATPVSTITTSAAGMVALSAIAAPGATQKQGPFGKLAADGSNGVILLAATLNGVTDYQWIKAWQLSDAARRGNAVVAVEDVSFDLPTDPIDPATDLAAHRIVTDSVDDLPAKLQPLVDGGASVDLPSGAGSWIEVDLGRDRPIAEIRLSGNLWAEFDIEFYGTGQKPSEAVVWARERNWNWSRATRGDAGPGGSAAVAYRSPALRGRFVRLVNRSPRGGTIDGFRVSPIKQ